MLLVIETATEACSVALFDGDALLVERHEIVGRGHAERLIPMIAELPGRGRASRILVDCGPGSFTGVRVGIAAARALALGWNAGITGYSSLALIASAGFAKRATTDTLAVAINGGHGEMFVQRFERNSRAALDPFASLSADYAVAVITETLILGNAAAELVAARGHGEAAAAFPRAADAMLLPPAFAALEPRPIYGRAPDAKPQA